MDSASSYFSSWISEHKAHDEDEEVSSVLENFTLLSSSSESSSRKSSFASSLDVRSFSSSSSSSASSRDRKKGEPAASRSKNKGIAVKKGIQPDTSVVRTSGERKQRSPRHPPLSRYFSDSESSARSALASNSSSLSGASLASNLSGRLFSSSDSYDEGSLGEESSFSIGSKSESVRVRSQSSSESCRSRGQDAVWTVERQERRKPLLQELALAELLFNERDNRRFIKDVWGKLSKSRKSRLVYEQIRVLASADVDMFWKAARVLRAVVPCCSQAFRTTISRSMKEIIETTKFTQVRRCAIEVHWECQMLGFPSRSNSLRCNAFEGTRPRDRF